MKKEMLFVLFFFFILSAIFFVSAEAVGNNLHLNIQTTNTTGIATGTFKFEFNISKLEDCSSVVYSNFSTMTTDSRGIISYYLTNVNLNFSEQYWLCYYRDGNLINASKIARTPYSFITKNISAGGIINDSNLDLTGRNIFAFDIFSNLSGNWNGTCTSYSNWFSCNNSGNTIHALFNDSMLATYYNKSENMTLNGYSIENASYIQTTTLNVTGTSYLGAMILSATNFSVDNLINKSGTNITFWGNILPRWDNVLDIGSPLFRFMNLYLGGNISSENLQTDVTNTSIGYHAGNNLLGANVGDYITAIGDYALGTNKGNHSVGIGSGAGLLNQGSFTINIGDYAGLLGNGENVTNIGYTAGRSCTGNNLINIGTEAGRGSVGDNNIFLGTFAGYDNLLDNLFILIQANVNANPLIWGNFSSGFVGIGTSNPTSTLYVNGNITQPENAYFYGGMPGEIRIYAGAVEPAGWVWCNGSTYLRTDYPNLYNALGVAYGSNSADDFKVPDLRGLFPRGAGVSGEITMANGSQMNGGDLGTYMDDSLQGHWHNYHYTMDAATGTTKNRVTAAGEGTNDGVFEAVTDGVNGNPRLGGETAPASVSVNYIIKT